MYTLHLQVVDGAIHINKGTNSEIDSYSAFWDNKKLSQTKLVGELTKRKVTDVYICGLAYDVCVGEELLLFCLAFPQGLKPAVISLFS